VVAFANTPRLSLVFEGDRAWLREVSADGTCAWEWVLFRERVPSPLSPHGTVALNHYYTQSPELTAARTATLTADFMPHPGFERVTLSLPEVTIAGEDGRSLWRQQTRFAEKLSECSQVEIAVGYRDGSFLELREQDDNGCVGTDHFVGDEFTRLFWKEEGLPWELVQRTHESEDHDSEVSGWSKSEELTQDWVFATCFGTFVRRLEKASGSSEWHSTSRDAKPAREPPVCAAPQEPALRKRERTSKHVVRWLFSPSEPRELELWRREIAPPVSEKEEELVCWQ